MKSRKKKKMMKTRVRKEVRKLGPIVAGFATVAGALVAMAFATNGTTRLKELARHARRDPAVDGDRTARPASTVAPS